MTNRRIALALLALTGLAAMPAHADEYSETLSAFRKAEASGRFFKNAHGYAVFPTIGKGGVGIGGAYGKGKVYEKGRRSARVAGFPLFFETRRCLEGRRGTGTSRPPAPRKGVGGAPTAKVMGPT